MNKDLNRLQNFVDQMKATSSLNEKKVIIGTIKNDEFIKRALKYAYDPYKKYYVTSANCKKRSDLYELPVFADLFCILDDLNGRYVTGHDAIGLVNGFIKEQDERFEDLIFSIIDRNLELRASASVINKVIPGLIPTFDVALANKFDPKRADWNDVWLASRKLDGVRCLTIVDIQGNVKCYSRQGNEFETLDVVREAVMQMGLRGVVFDGEICLMDKNGDEDFPGIMKQIKRKNHTIDNPRYVMFDYLTLSEFDSKTSEMVLTSRLGRFAKVVEHIESSIYLSVLNQIVVTDDDHFAKLSAEAEELGHEGLMVRKNVGYEGKRTQNLLKVKKFFDAEYQVVDLDFEDHRVIREGKEVVMPMLAQVWIEHKGYKVAVGSGWNQEQRIRYQKNPSELIGKTITVQYFEETKNQQGGISLRFPTVKHVFENGRNC
jgi:DNA ligase-1